MGGLIIVSLMSAINARFPDYYTAINTPNKAYGTGEEIPIAMGDTGERLVLGKVYDEMAKVGALEPSLESTFFDVNSTALKGTCGFYLSEASGEHATDIRVDCVVEVDENVLITIPMEFVEPIIKRKNEQAKTLIVQVEDTEGGKVTLDGIIDDYGDEDYAIFWWRAEERSCRFEQECRMLVHAIFKRRHEGQRLCDAKWGSDMDM